MSDTQHAAPFEHSADKPLPPRVQLVVDLLARAIVRERERTEQPVEGEPS